MRNGVLGTRCGLVAFLVLSAMSAFAHDPYEITSTVRLNADGIELQVEMEFPASMLLVGVDPAAAGERLPADLFVSHLPQLKAQAGRFVEIASGSVPLHAESTNVTLEVEDHVFFRLSFPATELRSLRVSVPGLQTLAGHGPFGTTLTVLDMVHQKVMGQEVLFADSPAVEFGGEPATASVQVSSDAPVPTPERSAGPDSAPQTGAVTAPADLGQDKGSRASIWIAVVAVVLLGIVWSCARRGQA